MASAEPSAIKLGKRKAESQDIREESSETDSDVEVVLIAENKGEIEQLPFYAVACPICLSPPSPLVVTRCGHTFCGACLHAALAAEETAQLPAGVLLTWLPPQTKAKLLATSQGDLADGKCPTCRTVLKGGWGKAARGVSWCTDRRKIRRRAVPAVDETKAAQPLTTKSEPPPIPAMTAVERLQKLKTMANLGSTYTSSSSSTADSEFDLTGVVDGIVGGNTPGVAATTKSTRTATDTAQRATASSNNHVSTILNIRPQQPAKVADDDDYQPEDEDL